MDLEIFKKISENFYINIDSIINDIRRKDKNINTGFRMAYEELLSQLNDIHKFVENVKNGFYNTIINNKDYQFFMIEKYKCTSKLMHSFFKIHEIGNKTAHNKLKIFDEVDVKDSFYCLLVLCKKFLIYERNVELTKFTKPEIYNLVDELMKESSEINTDFNKSNFVDSIIFIIKELNYCIDDFDAKKETINKFKNIFSIIINYIIVFENNYNSLNDLKIGVYNDLYNAYVNIENIINYNDEGFIASLYEYYLLLKNILESKFNIDITKEISFDKLIKNKEDDQKDSYSMIADAIESYEDSNEDNKIKGIYYVESQKEFYANNKIYYAVILKKAINDRNKGIPVYSKNKINSNYATLFTLKKATIKFLGNNVDIFIIDDYKISIRPCEIDWLIRAILNVYVKTKKENKFYKILMDYLQDNNTNLYNILTYNNKQYNDFKNLFIDCSSLSYIYFIQAMDKARKIISDDCFDSGANLLRYFTYKLVNEHLKNQVCDEEFNGLYFKRGSHRFDRNPYSFSLLKHNVNTEDLFECISPINYEEDFLIGKIKQKINKEDRIFIDTSEYGLDAMFKIDKYNKYLKCNYDSKGLIKKVDDTNYVYVENDLNVINHIIDAIGKKGCTTLPNDYYKDLTNEFINNVDIDSPCKLNILKNAFNNSCIALINGEAGTGKTELLCNYFTNIFKGKNILYVSNTHSCKNNMINRVQEKSGMMDSYQFKTATSIAKMNNFFELNYDVIIIDECKSISNRNMESIIEHVNADYIILAGDVGQINAIQLGNWFDIVLNFADKKNVFYLENKENFRTNNDNLRKLWDKVLNRDNDVFEYLKQNDYVQIIDENVFKPFDEDEIILCLNYGGLFGITSINSYFQNRNYNMSFRNNLDFYKVGDPIIFNENANDYFLYDNIIYNNLTGKIIDISDDADYLYFKIEINNYASTDNENVIFANKNTGKSIIYLPLKKYNQMVDEKDENIYKCPFDLNYALSIHKAQGLEFNSVKIIITPESENIIDNKLFYTAITRSKKHLKIYLTSNNQEQFLKKILQTNKINKDVEFLKLLREEG